MDTFELLNEKIAQIKSEDYLNDLSFIMVHINRAEKYFKLGQENSENDYYNDVIYRTNQAYEGGLRCAYKILLEKEHLSKSTYMIEEELTNQNILNKRVKNMFSIYRNDWRNESTHHYDFIVDQSEALMAINNVSSFIYLLLDQIKEKDAYIQAEKEKERIKNLPFSDYIIQSLLLYPSLQNVPLRGIKKIKEVEVEIPSGIFLTHSIEAYLKNLDSKIEVFKEDRKNNQPFDFYIRRKENDQYEEQYIEIKCLRNPFAIKNTLPIIRKKCKMLDIKDIILFIWSGFGEYKLTENLNEDINIKIISKI